MKPFSQIQETFNSIITPWWPREKDTEKLSPSLGGTLITSRDRSDFTLESQRDSWQLHFQTPWDEWYEKIIRLDSQELVLEHNNKRYYYKRKNPTDGRP